MRIVEIVRVGDFPWFPFSLKIYLSFSISRNFSQVEKFVKIMYCTNLIVGVIDHWREPFSFV